MRTALATFMLAASAAAAQNPMEIAMPEPIPMGTTRGESASKLVIRNAVVVSGRGSENGNRAMPPEGPVDIVIENGLIVNMIPVDPVNAAGYQEGQGRSAAKSGEREIDASGMYVIPALVEMHAHLRGNGGDLGPRALEYQYLLYLGHGITTIRDAGSGAGLEPLTEERRRSAAQEIVAPRLVLCQRWPLPLRQWDVGNTPDSAREMVRRFKELGADCVKVSKSPGHYPDVLRAIVEEGNAIGLPVMVDLKVSETDAVTASEAGVRSIEHWYGIPDAALPHSQDFPADYNYWDELDRFRWAGALWAEAAEYPDKLSAVIDLMIENGTNWDPTMVVYEDNRDLGRAVTLPWLSTLAHPSVVEGLWPNAAEHGAFKREWKTSDEVRWKKNFQIWMRYVKEFHEKGGLLTAGSDTGPMGGPALIRELELLQEAGLHPIDVIRVATTNAKKALGMDDHCGLRVGCVADLAVVNGNPIDNLKVLYGLGYGFYGIADPAEQWKQGGVRWTIKEGVLYDAPALLREVLWYVQQEKLRGATDN
jgi:imidazolonepropionase-like amidohydrolase